MARDCRTFNLTYYCNIFTTFLDGQSFSSWRCYQVPEATSRACEITGGTNEGNHCGISGFYKEVSALC